MAPNKKKKKLASSSTRGFATTSAPSKKKDLEVENVALESSITSASPVKEKILLPEATPALPPESSGKSKQFELSPEELEEQLERSELQMLIDKFGEDIQRIVARQVARLHTEKRLLRNQAIQMKNHKRLPNYLGQIIVAKLTTQGNEESGSLARRNLLNQNISGESADNLLMKIWTLHRLLPLLGFSSFHRDDVLKELLKKDQMGTIRTDMEGKDLLWGLDFCLNFLARFSDSHDLSSYDTTSDRFTRQRSEPKAREIRTPTSTPDDSRSSTPLNHPPLESQPAAIESDTAGISRHVMTESESEVDSDWEPEEMTRKYVEWQKRRFQIFPQDAEPSGKHGRAQKRQTLDPVSVPRAVARLDSRIARLKSDILFDLDEAERQWAMTRNELVREDSDRRKLNLDKDVETKGRVEHQIAIEEVDEEGPLLGELFSSLPETNQANGGGMTVTDSTGLAVTVRDFGKWIGMAPRRILEESCRARDSSSRISVRSLSETTFSKRHQVQIEWSRDQNFTIDPFLFDGVICEISSRRISVEMANVACPDVSQSEAFISTIALFVIFGLCMKDEKVHLRLPSVWRDLWGELTLLRKQQSDERDIQTLRELRALIAEHTPDIDTNNKTPKILNHTSPAKIPLLSEDAPITEIPSSNNTETLKLIWANKASTNSYQAILTTRKALPIWNFKEELLSSFNENQIVIVCGETGCGKSTQVPSYILEHELSSGRPCKIYCTEPRRISAISLARRVSEELGERRGDVGTSRSIVGFAVRLDSQVTSQTKLVYATTGIVMRMLETNDGLEEVTHLVLDEVHERSIESDFLLIVLRKLVKRRPNLKVVLMSATVDAERFSRYLDGAPVFNIPGRTFPVETKFLEDAIETTGFRISEFSKGNRSTEDDEEVDIPTNTESSSVTNLNNYKISTRETVAKFNEYHINYDLIVKLLEAITTDPKFDEYSKAILIFLPGIAEIRRLHGMLVGNPHFSRAWAMFPLHSTIAMEEQERAFLVPPVGVRKLVIATNIAETGITIPDVTCVIDTGKHKEIRFDERKQLSRLIEAFISKANAKQRRGRAGRVQKGLCFHLFTQHRHDFTLPDQQTPEMLRLSLQDLVLRVKICKLGSIAETLAEALDPPSAKNVQRAVDALIDVKALTVTQDLTSLGHQLAKLPLDVFLGKLVLLGTIFGCLDGTLAIAAILSSKSPFLASVGKRNEADLARLHFKKGDSDLLTVYNAYCNWRRICNTKHGMTEQQFCHRNCLSAQTLASIEELKGQLLSAVVDARFVALNQEEKLDLNRIRSYSRHRNFVPIVAQYNNNNNNDLMLNSLIACSFYPKLLKRDGKGWRNVANNQSVSLHPTSVNKGIDRPPQWLSFYHIMQSSNKFYNAHETSAVEDIAIALLCGEADFKMYSGVLVIDGNRVRFALNDWKQILAIKTLRSQIQKIMAQAFRHPGQQLSAIQKEWMDILCRVLTVEEKQK